jgi:2-oxoglutarate/2-oxoacid ferredoxin oxidoreductase subunit alpha
MQPLSAVNDFVVKFANINGSGSASANELFALSILRMGVPVASRNIFPSNIQGLPTWYEVRVSGEGWLARRGGVDLMVALNPQTWDKDVGSVVTGGYLLYDSTKPLPASKFRADLQLLPIPLTEICNRAYSDPRQRLLFKNIVYVGALTQLLGMDLEAVKWLVAEQFEKKKALLPPNLQALGFGYEYARDKLKDLCRLKVKRQDKVGERIFIQGNNAAALGCIWAGATVCAWYPITPSTSLAEAFARHCRRFRVDPKTKKNNFAIVQAEDEIAAIGMVAGANWNGARAFTATSGPGISLMSEIFGFAYYAEVPVVVFDVQRGGPSTGMPTRTQQSDILLTAYASHGDTKHVLLLPQDPRECFDFAIEAFDLAERLQTPVFVMLDLDIGMNDWLCEPLKWDGKRKYDRGKVMTAEELEAGKEFARYLDVDGDGIPYRTLPGTHPKKGAYFTRGSSHDRYARYSEAGEVYTDGMERLLKKFETAKTLVPQPVVRPGKEKTAAGAIYFGSTAVAMDEAVATLEKQGVHLDLMRLRAFPFSRAVTDFIAAHDKVFVVEQNRDSQMLKLIVAECGVDPGKFVPIRHFDGTPITARFIIRALGGHAAEAAE